MKFIRLAFFVLPIILSPGAFAQSADDTPIDDAGSGTFPLEDQDSNKALFNEKKEVGRGLEVQEEEEVDSFGESEFNQNVDPDEYEVDRNFLKQ